MNILICPDKFKGSLSADKVCEALKKGLCADKPNLKIVNHPMADGGDGSINILKSFYKFEKIQVETIDPLGRVIIANYYKTEDSAYIELASAAGLVLLDKEDRNPVYTSTEGTGIMMSDAIGRGLKKIYLFIGGSATNDAGIGIAKALGYDFLDAENQQLRPIGGNLEKIHAIRNNSPYDFSEIEINVLCDVENPMHGVNGAAHTYAGQKGASESEINYLDKGLKKYAEVLKSETQKEIADIPGMGAAGAVGASLVGLLNAKLIDGFQMVSRTTKLEKAIQEADLVITGEGKIDPTSFQGKVVGNVLKLCKQHDKPCGVIAGMIEELSEMRFKFYFQESIISRANNQQEAMANPETFLYEMGKDIASKLL